jgi:hypothetical protein
MKLIPALLSATAAFAFSSTLALADEPERLVLEGLSLQMTETQVRAAMQAQHFEQVGGEGAPLKYHSSFEQLVAIKSADPEKFEIYQSTAELRFENDNDHLVIGFMPFVNETVVTSVVFFPSNVPWMQRTFPNCHKFADETRQKYGVPKGENSPSHFRLKAPMEFGGQMKPDGQIISTNCSPRFNANIRLYNPYARDLLVQQIDNALLE